MNTRVAAGLLVILGFLAPAAEAKLMPRFDTLVAATGEPVTVELGYTEPYRAPLEVFLVRTRDEPFVRSRTDRRLSPIGRVRCDRSGSMPSSVSFVARVRPGRYTVAVWFRGTATGRWHNAAAGLWRSEPRLVLRVVVSRRG